MFSPKQALCLLIFFYLVAFECNCEGLEEPAVCANLECPSYTVIYSEKEFEIRNYKEAFWVMAPEINRDSPLIAKESSNNLYLSEYYRGNNAQHVNISETAPVLVDALGAFYRVYFYLPQKYQNGGVPKPLNPAITVIKLPRHKYAVARRFLNNEYTDSRIAVEIDALKRNLQGTTYQRAAASDVFTVAVYNKPGLPVDQVYDVILWLDEF